MIGLPFLETVAASTGRIVAMVSPGEMQTHGNFAWARTLKHEMTHVFNLQQTGYNIPHWFTEGLAVNNEKISLPYRWTLLLRRRAAANTLMDLETVNAGFARAMDGDECQLAYCQSELYVEYMLSLGGSDAQEDGGGLRGGSRDGGGHPQGVRHVAGGIRAGLQGISPPADRRHARTGGGGEREVDELEKAHRQQPEDAEAAARLALAYLQRGAKKEAADLAAEALKLQPKQQLATYVQVRLQKAGTPKEAMAELEGCLDRKAPEPLVLNLLAGLKLKAEKYDEAAELYALGERLDPANPQWPAGRAKVYLAAGQKQNLAQALARFAQIEPDDLPSRKKLAELALEQRKAAVARRWATEALEIQVEDADVHRLLAAALVELDELVGRSRSSRRPSRSIRPIFSSAWPWPTPCFRPNSRPRRRKCWKNCCAAIPNFPGPTPCWKAFRRSPRMEGGLRFSIENLEMSDDRLGVFFVVLCFAAEPQRKEKQLPSNDAILHRKCPQAGIK